MCTRLFTVSKCLFSSENDQHIFVIKPHIFIYQGYEILSEKKTLKKKNKLNPELVINSLVHAIFFLGSSLYKVYYCEFFRQCVCFLERSR